MSYGQYGQYEQGPQRETYQSYREVERSSQERSGLNVHPPSVNYFPSYRNQDSQDRSAHTASYPANNQRKGELKNKIREIIDLCKDQNVGATRDIAGVAEEERKIGSLLENASLAAGGMAQANYLPAQASNAPTSFNNFTPIRGHEQAHPGKNMQEDIRNIITQNGNVQLSEEVLQLINEIERRCLAQIEKIRNQKLALTGELNQEIKLHNGQKRRNADLEKELAFYRSGQSAAGGGAVGAGGEGRHQGQLREKVAYLQNMLQRVHQEGTSEGHPDFKILFAQGEAIRQQTIRLIRLKQAKGHTEDPQKHQLRSQMEMMRRKIEFLEQERAGRATKPSYEVINEQYSPIAPTHKKKDSYRNSSNEYESLVMEMRKITSN